MTTISSNVCRSAFMTVVTLTAVVSLNHTFKHTPPFYGLEHLTHWFLLLCASALVVRAHWWTSLVSTIGVIVLTLHWTLVSCRIRDRPDRENASHNLLCYLALPVLAVAAAVSTGSYKAPLSRTLTGLFVLVLVYTATLETHDRTFPDRPAYPNLPLPPPVFSVIAFILGAAWLGLMHALKPHAPFLSFKW